MKTKIFTRKEINAVITGLVREYLDQAYVIDTDAYYLSPDYEYRILLKRSNDDLVIVYILKCCHSEPFGPMLRIGVGKCVCSGSGILRSAKITDRIKDIALYVIEDKKCYTMDEDEYRRIQSVRKNRRERGCEYVSHIDHEERIFNPKMLEYALEYVKSQSRQGRAKISDISIHRHYSVYYHTVYYEIRRHYEKRSSDRFVIGYPKMYGTVKKLSEHARYLDRKEVK